jgi:N-acetylmuramoyl-L-alanine amidase
VRLAAATLALLAATSASHAETCKPAAFKIVLDVGHTVSSPGAISARGVPEYRFNLKLARRVEQELRDGGFVKTTVLITEGDGRVQLLRRAQRANMIAPDILISIHHDSNDASYMTWWVHNGIRYFHSDKFSGFSLFVARETTQAKASLALARLMAKELINRDLTFTTHHAHNEFGPSRTLIDPALGIYRFDELVVLRMSKAPAVLLEAGVIVNRTEEVALASPERQNAIAAALHAAIVKYCEAASSLRAQPRRRAPGFMKKRVVPLGRD